MKLNYICIECGNFTPRNFADEDKYNGVYCERCATLYNLKPNPPHTGISVIRPINQESLWSFILDNFKAGLYGDPKEPETVLRYWKEQEAAGYPRASENVQYFTDLVVKSTQAREGLTIEQVEEMEKQLAPCSCGGKRYISTIRGDKILLRCENCEYVQVGAIAKGVDVEEKTDG